MASETIGSEPKGPSTATAGVNLTDADVLGMLNRADIILTHGGSLTDWAIRWGTKSYWNHAAIVFLLEEQAEGYLRTFVLESEAPRGVDVHPIGKYFDNHHQDMAILRFPDSALPPGRRLEFLKRVRGFVLEEIDATYGHSAILENTQTILGPLGWLLKPVIRAAKVLTGLNRGKAVNDFICSGVIQYAYCRACYGANPDTGGLWDPFFSDTEARRNLIVNPQMREAFDPGMSFQVLVKQLKLTTPANFAQAVRDNVLECVAQRQKGVWATQLKEK